MALVAALVQLPVASTGDMEYTVVTISTLTGLQEPESGWVLANGAVLPSTGKYTPLYNMVGTNYGATPGTLPTLIDGVQPIGKGGTRYTALGGTDGAKVVTLGLSNVSAHQHTHPSSTIHVFVGSFGYCHFNDPLGDGFEDTFDYTTVSAGGGGSHNNMPPYVVVEGVLIRL